jgi:hypothetical protein
VPQALESAGLGPDSMRWPRRELGAYSALATVNWNALDADGAVVRDTWTTYQLLTTPDGWRFVSYTNHFWVAVAPGQPSIPSGSDNQG